MHQDLTQINYSDHETGKHIETKEKILKKELLIKIAWEKLTRNFSTKKYWVCSKRNLEKFAMKKEIKNYVNHTIRKKIYLNNIIKNQ